MKVGAILLDTRSIQRYIFAGNKLKTHIGASYLVEHIFKKTMQDTLCELQLVYAWDTNKKVTMLSNPKIEVEVLTIGGGNMRLLVRAQGGNHLALCRRIIQTWSQKVLLIAPGLQTGVAIGELDLETHQFNTSWNALYQQLKHNQNTQLPIVDFASPGFTLECDVSGKVANIRRDGRWTSWEVARKEEAASRAQRHWLSLFSDVLDDMYTFATDFNTLGYPTGESYIAIIHIDGNNMGARFSECQTVDAIKRLSQQMNDLVIESFRDLLHYTIQKLPTWQSQLMLHTDNENKRILPIRPIILGGDDITFVCPGRLGILLAEHFMKSFSEHQLLLDGELQPLHSCAGVAIISAKYPFFRGYEIAEQLCQEAKKASRGHLASFLDYTILHGEVYPSIEQQREAQYKGTHGYLHFGPYLVNGTAPNAPSLSSLLQLSQALHVGFASNKVKQLREVLHQDAHSMQRFLDLDDNVAQFITQQAHSEYATVEHLWEKRKTEEKGTYRVTPYMDAIELIDFLPNEKE